jgi:Fe-Mn family superoxide dismutase
MLKEIAMNFELPPLPYAKDALEPYISRQTLEFHYEKHHRGYLEKMQKAIAGTDYENRSLEEIIYIAEEPEIFNNAAQVWNHTFYWNSMQPDGGGRPPERLAALLKKSFGSIDDFSNKMAEEAETRFGSGYVWLILTEEDKLEIISTANAINPLRQGHRPLLTMDVWEHAYYLDYQNRRPDHVQAFLQHLLNWEFIEENLHLAGENPSFTGKQAAANSKSRRHH